MFMFVILISNKGYVYGNISAEVEHVRYTLAIVHEELFPVFYEGREHYPKVRSR